MSANSTNCSSSLSGTRISAAIFGASLTAALALSASPASAQFNVWPGGFYDRAQPYAERPVRRRTAPSYPKLADAPKNDLKPQGPLLIMVSIEKQSLKIYDERGLFAESPISSGTKDHPTPMGVFSILEKSKWHRSNLYSSAPMPFMQRITWSGVALHAGELPGYPASHGCIRLPAQFAARLWNWTKKGARVVVTPGEVTVANASHRYLIARMPQIVAELPAAPVRIRTADASSVMPSAVQSDAVADASPLRATIVETKPAEEKASTPEVTKSDDTAVAETKAIDTEKDEKEKAVDEKAAAEKTAAADVPTKAADDKATNDKPVEANTAEPAESRPPAESASAAPADAMKDAPANTAAAETSPAAPADTASIKDAAKPVDTAKPLDVAKPVEDKTATAAEPAKEVIKEASKDTGPAASVADAPAEKQIPVWMQLPKRSGQVAVLISRKDGKLYMRQNFDPVFEIPVSFSSDAPIGTHLFTVRKANDDGTEFEWSAVSLPGVTKTLVSRKPGKTPSGKIRMKDVFTSEFGPTPASASEALDRITIPEEALQRIAFNLSPGSSILISDLSFNTGGETGRGTEFIVPLR